MVRWLIFALADAVLSISANGHLVAHTEVIHRDAVTTVAKPRNGIRKYLKLRDPTFAVHSECKRARRDGLTIGVRRFAKTYSFWAVCEDAAEASLVLRLTARIAPRILARRESLRVPAKSSIDPIKRAWIRRSGYGPKHGFYMNTAV